MNHEIAHLLVRATTLTHRKTPEVNLAERSNHSGQIDASLAKRHVARFGSLAIDFARREIFQMHASEARAVGLAYVRNVVATGGEMAGIRKEVNVTFVRGVKKPLVETALPFSLLRMVSQFTPYRSRRRLPISLALL